MKRKQTTYNGWRNAVRHALARKTPHIHHTSIVWDGNRDICNAYWMEGNNKIHLGQWDGAEGYTI